MTDRPATRNHSPATVPVWMILAVIVGLIAVDQVTKFIAIATLKDAPPIIFAGDLFRLQYAENLGAFLSLGANLSGMARFLLLTVFNVAIVAVMSYMLVFRRPGHRAVVLALTLIIAGGIGNLIDRIFRDGVVIDFLNVGIGGLRSGIFNIADLAIVAGFVLFVCFGHKAGGETADTGTADS